MRSEIIAKLEKEILPLQGFRPLASAHAQVELGNLLHAFPNKSFPTGAIHEFTCDNLSNTSSTIGFISTLIKALTITGGVTAWVGAGHNVFPHGLTHFGIDPNRLLFIHPKRAKDLLWSVEEALKCAALTTVVADMKELSFMASRRLQLAVEKSLVTGFILRRDSKKINVTASMTKWKISSMESILEDDMPGVGFPMWKVQLLKVRNGRPGEWIFSHSDGKLQLRDAAQQAEQESYFKTA